MVDLVREVKLVALLLEHHDDVSIVLQRDMEATRDSIDLEETGHLTALLAIKFLLDSFDDGSTPLVPIIHALSGEYSPIHVDPLFEQLSHDITLMSSQDVLDIESQHITRDERKSDVQVHWHEVVSMRQVHDQFSF